ncbi:MexH family multidrug efflux RND transporter periplasmic adaptor subunit [Skermanella aerolata]|uniref:MexH family multidrug efflux RND transporter periplasmic adaptor subunit n=2 Tax=Skermanella aerolata TaxID=393310 RepID=A0A512DRY9_9PROT|nr:MexH family multidrug efflux RND transporter periplasmic adaptor subunit [Skermanella aerolata]
MLSGRTPHQGRPERRMKLFSRLIILAALLGAGGAAYWYYNVYLAGTMPVTAQAPAPASGGGGPPGGIPVEAQKVEVGAVSRSVTSVGTLFSDESVIIRPEVAGKITEIRFSEGQAIRKGAVVLRMDDAIARATVDQALASLNLSKTEADRADELYRQGSGSARARDQARAKLLADEASVTLARAQLAKLELNAPFDGVLGLRRVSVGDVVQAGKDIVNLEAIETLKLDFRVPELYLPSVKVGQTLNIVVDAVPDRKFAGTVFAIDPLVDVNGRSINVRARVPNKDDALRPGLFARVNLTLTTRENSILVPEQAMVAVGVDQFVFKVVDGKVARVKVRTGERRAAKVEILDGLSPDDVIVTAGHLKIRDGVPVTVVPAVGS